MDTSQYKCDNLKGVFRVDFSKPAYSYKKNCRSSLVCSATLHPSRRRFVWSRTGNYRLVQYLSPHLTHCSSYSGFIVLNSNVLDGKLRINRKLPRETAVYGVRYERLDGRVEPPPLRSHRRIKDASKPCFLGTSHVPFSKLGIWKNGALEDIPSESSFHSSAPPLFLSVFTADRRSLSMSQRLKLLSLTTAMIPGISVTFAQGRIRDSVQRA